MNSAANSAANSGEIRRLGPEEAEAYRHLRLEGLRRHPDAFGESYADAAGKPPHHWPEMLETAGVFGAWREGRLIATAACVTAAEWGLPAHLLHKAFLIGVYTRPKARGAGFGRAVCQAAVDHARGLPRIDQIMTAVQVDNVPARTLYETLGFVVWGRQPRALKVQGRYHDEFEMALLFDGAEAE